MPITSIHRTQSSSTNEVETWQLRQRISILEKELRKRDIELNAYMENIRELHARIRSLEEEIEDLTPRNKIGTPRKYARPAASLNDLLYPRIGNMAAQPVDEPPVDAAWDDVMVAVMDELYPDGSPVWTVLYRDNSGAWCTPTESMRFTSPVTAIDLREAGIDTVRQPTEADLEEIQRRFRI